MLNLFLRLAFKPYFGELIFAKLDFEDQIFAASGQFTKVPTRTHPPTHPHTHTHTHTHTHNFTTLMKRLQHRYCPVNIAKFLRARFL